MSRVVKADQMNRVEKSDLHNRVVVRIHRKVSSAHNSKVQDLRNNRAHQDQKAHQNSGHKSHVSREKAVDKGETKIASEIKTETGVRVLTAIPNHRAIIHRHEL